MSKRFVVITTDHTRRGVFAGNLVEHENGRAVLEDAQMCLYWSETTRGVLGLAAIGPQSGSRIGPPVSRLELDGVTAVIDATDEAEKKWKAQPWSS
jgi:hypothetical protein